LTTFVVCVDKIRAVGGAGHGRTAGAAVVVVGDTVVDVEEAGVEVVVGAADGVPVPLLEHAEVARAPKASKKVGVRRRLLTVRQTVVARL
jgi:hypothetical protein